MAYVYRHIRLDKNEPFYIGIGSDTNYKRAYSKRNRNKYWNNIVAKSEYRVDILLDDISREEAIQKEVEFINLYGRRDKNTGTLSNLTDGGEGIFGYVASMETRLKMGLSQMGNQKYKLRTTPIEEINKKISIANKGKKMSDEFKQKLSKAFSGSNNPNYGVKMSDEQKEKIRNSHKCFTVHQFDLSGNLIKTWPSTKSVREAGFDQANVWRCCNGITKTHKKYTWKYGK